MITRRDFIKKTAVGTAALSLGGVLPGFTAKSYANIIGANDRIHAPKYAVKAENPTFDYPKIIARKNKVVKKLTAGIRMKLNNLGVTMVNGAAEIKGKGADNSLLIQCGEESYEAANLLICTGSETVIPPIPGLSESNYWTSREALVATELPKSLVIIGGGVIGMEFASFFNSMILKHFQRAGHRPIALIGGATGMIGDPSMKSAERNLLDEETLRHNQDCIKAQLAKFLDFDSNKPNAAKLVNNYDWMKNYTFLNFIRDIGKHITVNYMMAKDSVKKRLSRESEVGMSFTEFSYQLLQGYDFLYLYEHEGCRLQMGGADQWGNITTGSELIRRMINGEAFALTCPLITKADGGKFGKTESGNVWLDRRYTSPYKFYQFWLNVSDADAAKYIKIFTDLSKEEIDALVKEQEAAPHLRPLQKRLAKEVTIMNSLITVRFSSGLISSNLEATTSALGLPIVECNAGNCLLILLKLTVSASTIVICPIPARQICSAA